MSVLLVARGGKQRLHRLPSDRLSGQAERTPRHRLNLAFDSLHGWRTALDGLRAAAVELKGGSRAEDRATLGAGFVAFDAIGNRLPSGYRPPTEAGEPTRAWTGASVPSREPCTLRMRGLSGATPISGRVVTRIQPYPGIVGGGLLVCVAREFRFSHWQVNAALVLNAARPGNAAPVQIFRGRAARLHVPRPASDLLAAALAAARRKRAKSQCPSKLPTQISLKLADESCVFHSKHSTAEPLTRSHIGLVAQPFLADGLNPASGEPRWRCIQLFPLVPL